VPRPDKVAAVSEVQDHLTGAAATLLTDYRGLTVTELGQLRAELRKTGASYRVVKNTLARRAAEAAGIEGLHDYLLGPTALVFCEEDPVGPAKALKAFAKDHPDLLVKAGYVDGEVLDEAATVRLADLESREDLLARLAGLMNNALAGFARLLQAPLSQQARLAQALIDAGGAEAKGFAAAEAPAAEEATAEEAAPEETGTGDEAPAVVEAATDAAGSAVEAAADAVATVAERAADAVETVAGTVADAAEAVADAAEDATAEDATAEAATAEDGSPEETTDDEA
jgi:large subunit ribosomal protein L10